MPQAHANSRNCRWNACTSQALGGSGSQLGVTQRKLGDGGAGNAVLSVPPGFGTGALVEPTRSKWPLARVTIPIRLAPDGDSVPGRGLEPRV